MSNVALVIRKTLCIEYLLLRQWWPTILRESPYVDSGDFRTYIVSKTASRGNVELQELFNQLIAEKQYYRWVEVSDNPIETPPDYETHHLPTED